MNSVPNSLKPGINDRERLGIRNRLYGVYPGVVEYNLDPLRTGRCKVRVPLFHKTEKSVETKDLPWAIPVHTAGGVHDVGTYMVPPVGATVFVQYMAGDPEQPIYFGGWYKNPVEHRDINFKTSKETGAVLPDLSKRRVAAGQWIQPIGPEIPKEAAATPYHDPTVKIILKSLKGHTVMADDRDGFEHLKVVDRAGQQLSMHGPIQQTYNDDNSEQRGRKEARDNDDLDYDKLESGGSTLELVGTGGQRVRFVSGEKSEWVELVSQTPPGSQEPKSNVRISLGAGTGTIELSGNYEGKETFRLQIETATGQVSLVSDGGLRITADMISLLASMIFLQGNVHVGGDLRADGDISASGRVLGRSVE